MLQWPIFNTNIIEICEGVDKVNYKMERHVDPTLLFY
jgi:hypothetical protein